MEKRIFQIKINTERLGIGLVLGALAAGLLFWCGAKKLGVAVFALFAATGMVELRARSWVKAVLNTLWVLAAIVIAAQASQMNALGTDLWALPRDRLPAELLSAAVLCGVFFLLSMELRLSFVLGTLPLILLSVANGYVVQFRGNAIMPADLANAQTAWNVAGNYHFGMTPTQAYGLAAYLYIIHAGFSLPDLRARRKWLPRLAALLAALAIAGSWAMTASRLEISTWANYGAEGNGYLANFSAQLLEDLRDKRPEGYGADQLKSLEQTYAAPVTAGEKPTIIVVMNESFADLRVLGDGLHTAEPVMPFFDSLQENTVKGYALASAFGGTTANSEYEFLTGNTMGFFSNGPTVYQLYLKSPSYSMLSPLKALGYRCIATHPFESSGWSRTRAWPYLGFDEMTFQEDYPHEDLVRSYVSDREMFDYIIRRYENRDENVPLFLFGVTMQNHGNYSYTGEGYTPNIALTDCPGQYPDAEQYLGLIRESDKAMEHLLGYFREVSEPVVIVWFGDHLPKLSTEFYEHVHGGSYDTLDEQQLQHMVPFAIWANYDIPEQQVELTGLNYLSGMVFRAAGISLPPYDRFLTDLSKTVPAINGRGYYSLAEGCYLPVDEAQGSEKAELDRYHLLQYNAMFDRRNRSEVFFPVP